MNSTTQAEPGIRSTATPKTEGLKATTASAAASAEASTDAPVQPAPQAKRSKQKAQPRPTLRELLNQFGTHIRPAESDNLPAFLPEIYLTKQNLADLLGVCRVSVLNWQKAGKLRPSLCDDSGYPLFSLRDLFIIARNAIRTGQADRLKYLPLPGPSPTLCAPR